jgi:outer membrane protein TolC
MKYKHIILNMVVAVSCFYGHSVYAETLLPKDILQSSREYFPQILEAREKLSKATANVQQAEGQFDASIESQLYSRPSGYYDGREADARIVKPLPYYNSKIYGGYRTSDGSFPIYEDKRVTNDRGEFLFGAEFSLLRDSLIDSKRAKLSNKKIDKDIATVNYLMRQLMVQHDALYHYWVWVSAGKQVKVYQTLLNTAKKRQKALQKKVEKGDVAEIFLTENQQNILKRQGHLQDALRNFNIASNQLALYYRDDQNVMLNINISQLPEKFPTIAASKDKKHAIEVVNTRPELQEISYQIDKLQNEEKLGQNSLLPKANIGVEYSTDQGDGDISRSESESIVKLGISIPLQRNLGKGRVSAAKASIRQLEFKQRLLRDKLINEINNAFVNLDTAKRFVQFAQEEAILAKKLEEAEKKRFNNGQSDFFVLNMREEKTAEAEVKTIKAKADYYITLTHLYALTIDKKALGLHDDS